MKRHSGYGPVILFERRNAVLLRLTLPNDCVHIPPKNLRGSNKSVDINVTTSCRLIVIIVKNMRQVRFWLRRANQNSPLISFGRYVFVAIAVCMIWRSLFEHRRPRAIILISIKGRNGIRKSLLPLNVDFLHAH